LNSPNRLTAQDWEGWLYRRGYNFVSLGQKDGVEMPVTAAGEGTPLLLTRKLGQGKMTYVDLALTPQWLNVQPGAYRLLANLISY
ncbi:PIG-L family deacetylase, partial [candidate division KSB1 bacterium]|nr:PIG-L family deacetylase [candidate division KSB1 bacterium]